jgi:hypothetical protein
VSLFSTTQMAATEIDNVVTTKLLTLLNASVTKVRKRKRDFDDSLALPPVKKMGGKRVVAPNVEEDLEESDQEPNQAAKEGPMVEINDKKDVESATSFVSSFSRFSSKTYPPTALDTCQLLHRDWLAFILRNVLRFCLYVHS